MNANAKSDRGAIEFIVGEERASVYVMDSLITARFGVPIVHRELAEGNKLLFDLTHIPKKVFEALIQFLGTHELPDACLAELALALLALADQYDIPDLRWTCETYLCWEIQVSVEQSVRFQTEV
jgi:hypothetical protein